jgi:hypothetical protein
VEGNIEIPQWLGIEIPPGSESRARTHEGFSGAWPVVFLHEMTGEERSGRQPSMEKGTDFI